MNVREPELKGLINALAAFQDRAVRKAVAYVSPKLTIKLSRRHRPDGRSKSVDFVLTSGAPNYAEREFIKQLKKVKEPFPVKKVQLKFWPAKS